MLYLYYTPSSIIMRVAIRRCKEKMFIFIYKWLEELFILISFVVMLWLKNVGQTFASYVYIYFFYGLVLFRIKVYGHCKKLFVVLIILLKGWQFSSFLYNSRHYTFLHRDCTIVFFFLFLHQDALGWFPVQFA